MTDLIKFTYKNNLVRVMRDDKGNPWWVANDVCDIIGLDITQTRRLDDDEKALRMVQTAGGPQQMVTISESGLYNLISGSNKKELSGPFKKWIHTHALPTLRTSGFFDINTVIVDSLVPLSKEFRAGISIARAVGLEGTAAAIAANTAVKAVTGHDCLSLLGKPNLEAISAATIHVGSNATVLGMKMGCSAQETHKLLEEHGLITHYRDGDNVKRWSPTKKGIPHIIVRNTSKKNIDGKKIQDLTYLDSITKELPKQRRLMEP